jgi:D-glycero-D-manno-heptose 1,7-bisphosphate phosphatase
MNKAIFLDKDGTLIPDIPYNVDPDRITLSDDCVEGLKLLIDDGYKLIIVSNQSGIARGYFTEDQFSVVIRRLYELLNEQDIALANFYYCPHHPEGQNPIYALTCACRKPLAGMLVKAAEEHQIDLTQSWMIGDILNDVEAGSRAGCRTVLIDNGNETEWLAGSYRIPAYQCETINQAAIFIHNHILIDVSLERR